MVQDTMAVLRKAAAFLRLPGGERRCLVEAAWWLGLARLALLVLPFRRIAPWLSRQPRGARPDLDPVFARAIRRAVTTAARHVPWSATCLPQAMAAKMMLARRGCASTLHLGVARTGADGLFAHAWLEAGGRIIVGEQGSEAVTPVAGFG
jgi:hypothetical protein